MPSTPYDAKGLMIAAIQDNNPVIYMDDRWLYPVEDEVPEEIYTVSIGKGIVRKEGKDVTLAAISYVVTESMKASSELQRAGVDAEVIDLRTAKPLDETLLFESVKKTGRLVVVDGGWRTCGMAAEVSARVSENIFEYLKAPISRVTLPDVPAPASCVLEKEYYPDSKTIVDTVKVVLKG
jgi:pyruvate dehydrogenase E1 component beta subunit